MEGLVFKGGMKSFQEFYHKKKCEEINVDTGKWRWIGPSCMNDIKVINVETKRTYKMWAGTSGCNFMMVDKTGGCHSFLENDNAIYEFYNK